MEDVALHCVICFESFDLKERPPVVLPCGHTYVCLVCAKRLDRCMECRVPLYWKPPPQLPNTTSLAPPFPVPGRAGAHRYNATHNHGRGRYSPNPISNYQPAIPPLPREPIPLPIPKNVVLIGMIEASQRESRLRKESLPQTTALADESGSHDLDSLENSDDEDDEDLELNASTGIAALSASCGTYAVREREGLAVLPFDPNKQHHHHHHGEDEKKQSDEDDDNGEEEKKSEPASEPFTVEYGRTVQVVTIEEGVYKLARNVGYIVASSGQLVKVGAPQETSCKLEAMLETARSREQELQRSLEEVRSIVSNLVKKIEIDRLQPAVHPVISEPRQLPESDHGPCPCSQADPQSPCPTTPPTGSGRSPFSDEEPKSINSACSTIVELGDQHVVHNLIQDVQSGVLVDSPARSCPPLTDPVDMLSEDRPYLEGRPRGLPRYRTSNEDEIHGFTLGLGYGCGSSLFGERLLESTPEPSGSLSMLSFDDGSLADDNQTLGGRSRQTVASSPAVPSYVAQSPTRIESPVRSGSFDGVNFRTGMSGHRGLNQSVLHTTSPSMRRGVRMMSEHRGIGNISRSAAAPRRPGMHSPLTPRTMSPPDRFHVGHRSMT